MRNNIVNSKAFAKSAGWYGTECNHIYTFNLTCDLVKGFHNFLTQGISILSDTFEFIYVFSYFIPYSVEFV